jgi:hypothetical protein
MADNVQITAGSGTSIATDEVGVHNYQRMKITDGTPDSAIHLVVEEASAGAGRGSLWASLQDIQASLKNAVNAIVRPMWLNPISGAARVEIQSGTVTTVSTVSSVTTVSTVSTVSTCSAVTTLNQIAGYAAKDVMIDQMMRSNWALNVRDRIA